MTVFILLYECKTLKYNGSVLLQETQSKRICWYEISYKLGVIYSFEMISFMIHEYMKQIFKKEKRKIKK